MLYVSENVFSFDKHLNTQAGPKAAFEAAVDQAVNTKIKPVNDQLSMVNYLLQFLIMSFSLMVLVWVAL